MVTITSTIRSEITSLRSRATGPLQATVRTASGFAFRTPPSDMGIETDRDIVTVCHGGGNEKSVVSEPPIVTETGTKVVNRVTTTQTLTGDWYAETHGVTVTEKVVKDKSKKPATVPVS